MAETPLDERESELGENVDVTIVGEYASSFPLRRGK